MRRVLLVLVLLIAGAGCSSGAEPGPTVLPPLAATPSTTIHTRSAAPSSSGQTTSYAATPRGATAFTRHWISTLNAAYDTLDPVALSDLSSRQCRTCNNYIKSLEQAAAAGKRYEGGDVEVKQVVASAVKKKASTVLVDFEVPPLHEMDASGKLLRTFPSRDRATWQFRLERSGERWLVREVLLA